MVTLEDLTPGQRDALADLRLVEAQDGGLRVDEWRLADTVMVVTVALNCQTLRAERVADGLAIRDREFMEIRVPADYPVAPPGLSVRHERFAEYENVMAGGGICVFRSPDTEWVPSDGMGVFVRDRVWGWLRRAVRDEAERHNGAFHAPVVSDRLLTRDAIRYDALEPETDALWVGYAGVRLDDGRLQYDQSRRGLARWALTRWSERVSMHYSGELWGAGLLLPRRGGFLFPETLGALLHACEASGLAARDAVMHLGRAARCQGAGVPLFVIVGTPLGSAFPGRHHLTTLVLEGAESRLVWRAGGAVKPDVAIDAVLERADSVPLRAFYGRDARVGHMQRRDRGGPADWFVDKTVAIWGAGALGAPMAEYVVRAGAAHVLLRDYGVVHHGLLVRQPYTVDDEEVLKVDALKHRLTSIRPDVEVTASSTDLRRDLSGLTEWSGTVDLVINATASSPVRAALDRARAGGAGMPVLTVGVDARAERGFGRLLLSGAPASVEEIDRDAQIEVAGRADLLGYTDAFFPTAESERREPFYPEPGCSDATFVGSAADMASLSGAMLNWGAAALASAVGETPSAVFIAQPHVALASGEPPVHRVRTVRRTSLRSERGGCTVRLSDSAVASIQIHIAAAAERNGPRSETGGPLWGAYDDVHRIVWVDEAGPAPPGSTETPARFSCSPEGLQEEAAGRAAATRGAAGFVGTWHTHTASEPVPSATDRASMADVCTRAEPLPHHFLMLIVGTPHAAHPDIRAHVFSRSDYQTATP